MIFYSRLVWKTIIAYEEKYADLLRSHLMLEMKK